MRAVLTAHEIPLHISGEHHAAMVGLGAAVIALEVEVPREHAEEATALIRELREGGEAALADDEVPDDDTAPRQEETTADGALVVSTEDTLLALGRRKRLGLAIAVGVFLGHGTAHMSTRAWVRGLVLAGVQVMGWRAMFLGQLRLGAAVVISTMVMDLVGACLRIVQTSPPVLPTAVARPRRSLPGS